MNISHEVPLCLLKRSLLFNDYQYVLPHLIDKYEQYKEHMLDYRKQENSFIICDNGLFEGVTHTTEDLIAKINLIKPDIFIVPDNWNDKDTTYKNAKYWMNTLKSQLPPETNLMVVMQGMLSFMELYQECEDLGYKHFAFNHSSAAYQKMFFHPNKLINQALGRQHTINRMKHLGSIKNNHYIHLLGASLPQEFSYYKDPYFDFIKSVDSSSPIINGILGNYYKEHGLFFKPSEKIETFFEDDLDGKIGCITFNINEFKRFVK